MHVTGRTLIVLGFISALGAQALHAQAPAGNAASSLRACSLLTNADIAKATGRPLNEDPYDMARLCEFGSGRAILRVFSGPKPADQVDATLRNYQKDNDTKHPVSGLGSGAYVMFPTPRDEYEDTLVLVVAPAGKHMLMLTLAAEEGESAQSLQPAVITLMKSAQSRIR
jgi:hypothetical protein